MLDFVFEKFKSGLSDLGLAIIGVDEEGFIYVENGENSLKISLENVRRSYEQDGTLDHLDNLIESIRGRLIELAIPNWELAHRSVYWTLFPSNYEFGDFLNERVTDEFHKVYVYYDSGQYIWINSEQLREWQIEEQLFKSQVANNMNSLLDESNIEILRTTDGLQLAFFECRIEGVKSALLFSQRINQKVGPVVGWPIYCVLPVRDFCYMFSVKDEVLIGRLGSVVLNEYSESAYPVTKEVLLLSEEGVKSVGSYNDEKE